MPQRFMKKSHTCRTCYSPLESKYIDYCSVCIPKELRKRKKRMILSTVLGLILAVTAFYVIPHESAFSKFLTALFCFCLPFGTFIPLEFKTHRREAERNIYELEPLTGNIISGLENHRLDDVGASILSGIIFLVSGPFSLVYKICKLVQLQKAAK